MATVDLSTLGTRTIKRWVITEVENEHTGLLTIGKKLITENVVQPILNLEEARSLDAKWELCTMPGHEGRYMVKAGGRRFFVEPEVYDALNAKKPGKKDDKPNG